MTAAKGKILRSATSKSRKPPRTIFYVVSILIPVVFFLILETGLRYFQYGYDYTQWVSPMKGKYVLNPEIAHKYFHDIQTVPYSNGDIFDEVKRPNAFRIFVLGESSGAGYPFTPTGSFSRYLQERLRLVYPESRIEVINCSMTAINSFAMRDMMPGILHEKPDLILIYAGHNEYYGALGSGSLESFGTSRSVVNLVVALERLQTFQLVRNLLGSAYAIVGGGKQRLTGTLMARMAQNKYIGLNSDVYTKGIEQFEGNMRDILDMAKSNDTRVMMSTLVCNLKDQQPFVSVRENGYPPADSVYHQAQTSFARQDWRGADSLFRYAKDLDALRFRAPTGINNVIADLGREYHLPIVNFDSAFDALSANHIAGDNLMTDHLHPTLHGYQIMGDLFYRAMENIGTLPATKPRTMNDRQQDSITVSTFPFARLDSTVSGYRIKLLKNDWPYIAKEKKIPDLALLRPQDRIDSIAFELVEDRSNWDVAHRKAAEWYVSQNDMRSFVQTMNVLINQYPIVTDYYDFAANTLLERQRFDEAYRFLSLRNDMEPSAFSTKWLGTISLYRNEIQHAEKYLNESLQFNRKDAQVWYNLAGVSIQENDYRKALQLVNEALLLQPQYPGAVVLRKKLLETVQ